MRDSSCIFCKIAGGEIPSATIYEDEKFRVILDLGPASKGHALILPKEHFANIYELDEETAAEKGYDAVLSVLKNRSFGESAKIGLCFDSACRRYHRPGEAAHHFGWEYIEPRAFTEVKEDGREPF